MRLEFRAGDAFRTAIELLLLICLLASCGQKCLGGSNHDEAWSIQQTADGGYVVAGYTYSNNSDMSGNHGFSDRWRVLLNPSGNMEWQKRPGGTPYDEAYSVRQTADGVYVVTGRTTSNYGNVSDNNSSVDPWIIKQGEIDCIIAAPDTACCGSAGNVASTAESGDTYAWSITNGAITSESNAKSISFTAGTSGTTRLTLIVTKKGSWNECHKDIGIKPMPGCSWSSNAPVCNGTPVQFSGPIGMDSYQWDFGDGQASPSKDPAHLYLAPGTYAVTLQVTSGGCSKDCTEDISITPLPDCSWTSNAPVCNGTPVQFTGPTGMDSYQWDFGDGFACGAKNPVYLYHAPGTYTVTLRAAIGGCSKSCAGKVEVTALDCRWTSSSPVCNGTAVQFSGPTGMDAYQWAFGDGQVSPSKAPVHLYSAPGTYTVNLTAAKGRCTKTCPGIVEVRPMPDCSWTSSAPVCSGTPVQFTGPSGMDSYNWDFGDGAVSSAQGASHLYSAPGTYTVNLTAAKGSCSKSCAGKVEITAPDCSWTSNSPVCNGTSVQFSGPTGMDFYQWKFGDGAISSSRAPVHLYSAPGTYTVNLTAAKGGCIKSCSGSVEARPLPYCSWTSNAPVCNGMPVQFSGPTGMDSYKWDFGDGQIGSAQGASHLYPGSGTYMVNLTAAKGGCTKSCSGSVEVKPLPDCSWSSNSPVCNSTPVQFSGPSGMDSYQWDFGDGLASLSEDPAHLYRAPGTYTVNLTAAKGGCSKDCTKDISILPGTDCTITAPDAVCSRSKGNAASTATTGAAYAWSITNGEITSANDAQWITFTAGISETTRLEVTVTTASGCSKDCTKDISILPGPDCSWTSSSPICNGTVVQFSSPAGMDSYQWDFGDGQVSLSEDPAHLYRVPGTYTVNLTAAKGGCSKDCTKDISILPGPDCSWTSSSPVCNGTPVQFNGPDRMDFYQWDFGDGQVSSAQSASHLYSAPGTYAVKLTVAKGGCSKECTKDISILPGTDCTITAHDAVCSGSEGNAASTATTGAAYAWSITNGEITSASDAQWITFTAGTSGTTRLTVNLTKEGSWDECFKDIAIKPKTDSSLASDLPVSDSLAQQPSGMESHERDSGDGQVSSSKNKLRIYPG